MREKRARLHEQVQPRFFFCQAESYPVAASLLALRILNGSLWNRGQGHGYSLAPCAARSDLLLPFERPRDPGAHARRSFDVSQRGRVGTISGRARALDLCGPRRLPGSLGCGTDGRLAATAELHADG